MTHTTQQERRQERSHVPLEALGLWLGAAAKRSGAKALSIGTPDGLPIASWGTDEAWLMAAAGSLCAEGKLAQAHAEIPGLRAQPVHVHGMDLVVASSGAQLESHELIDTLERILA